MSRRKMKSRDKKIQKNSRNGLIELNKTTGEDIRISKREEELNIREGKPEKPALSRIGTRLEGKPGVNKKTVKRQVKFLKETKPVQYKMPQNNTLPAPKSEIFVSVKHEPLNIDLMQKNKDDKPESLTLTQVKESLEGKKETAENAAFRNEPNKRNGKLRIQGTAAYRQKKLAVPSIYPLKPEQKPAPEQKKIKEKQNKPADGKPTDIITEKCKKTVPTPKPDKSGNMPVKKLEKTERQAENAADKLEKAKNKLPAKKKLRSERVFNEEKGKPERKLYFEKEIKTQGERLKGSLPLRPVKFAANTVIIKAHSKVFQAENENVSVKAAHRTEMAAEGGVRSALRFHKTAPYRKVKKLEKAAAKKTAKLNYQKKVIKNPKPKSNKLSRMWQKRKIKKDYAKKAQQAKKAVKKIAETAKKAGNATVKATKLIIKSILKNPKVIAIIIIVVLLVLVIMALLSLGSSMGGGGFTAVLNSTYLSEAEDIENAAVAYSEWETDLRFQILNAETAHAGYDEYRYNIGAIGHNPLELMAYLTAVYHVFEFDAVSAHLQALFDEQYTLEFTPSAEVRYRNVIMVDVYTGESYEVTEAYEWHIMTVTLTSRPFAEVVLSGMSAEQRAHYEILMQSKGSRQYAGSPFDFDWLPFISSYYGWRVHPITGVKDLHLGIDVALPTGTEIQSAQNGVVTFAGEISSYGNIVIIENSDGITTRYAHCDTILVTSGQTVTAGDVIATVGNTGNSTGPHLHFELLLNGEYVNPLFFAHSGS